MLYLYGFPFLTFFLHLKERSLVLRRTQDYLFFTDQAKIGRVSITASKSFAQHLLHIRLKVALQLNLLRVYSYSLIL